MKKVFSQALHWLGPVFLPIQRWMLMKIDQDKVKEQNPSRPGKRVWWQWFSQGTDGKGGRCLHIFLISESLPQHPQHVMIILKMYFLLLLGGSFTELQNPKTEKGIGLNGVLTMCQALCTHHVSFQQPCNYGPYITDATQKGLSSAQGHRAWTWHPGFPTRTTLVHSWVTDFFAVILSRLHHPVEFPAHHPQ